MIGEPTRIKYDGDRARLFRHRLTLQVVGGPDKGRSVSSAGDCLAVGTAASNDLVLTDPSVSRFHLRIEPVASGYLLSDLESTNGTRIGRLRVYQVAVTADGPTDVAIGDSVVRLALLAEEEEIPLGEQDRFGEVLGGSTVMRELFRRLEAVARQDVTVLIEGETGTGKELVARAIHEQSKRRDGPFIVVDCGAIPPTLIEGEFFGHVRGAFTQAATDRAGAFEEASGGTVFLDEIGELDLAMQPRLLRVLEQGEVKRLGEARHRKIDLRVVAATHRDLQRSVNQGSFRADLFYRLSVVHLRIPPLRQRAEDIPLLVRQMLPKVARQLGLEASPMLAPETLQQMMRHPWPGNVRELRNFLERLAVYAGGAVEGDPERALALHDETPGGSSSEAQELDGLPFHQAKERCLDQFEVGYLARLLERCDYNVAEASRRSGIARGHLFRLIKKHQLRERRGGE